MSSLRFSMNFESPSKGTLLVEGHHEMGSDEYIFDLTSELVRNQGIIKSSYVISGDANTGIVKSIDADTNGDAENASKLDWTQIQSNLDVLGQERVNEMQREGFIAFSRGEVTIPKVIHMPFRDGDLHLKGAHSWGGAVYVLKIATGVPGNSAIGLAPNQGIMMAFDANSGKLLSLLNDEGHLTDLRTAIAGRNASEALMPQERIVGIGILGTGVQARLQVQQLESLYPKCRKLSIWGRSKVKASSLAAEMIDRGWDVTIQDSPASVARESNVIITTTAAQEPILHGKHIHHKDTLVIAIGADMPGKQELSVDLLQQADNVLIDSIVQGLDHGNVAAPIADGSFDQKGLQEFGDFLENGFHDSKKSDGLNLFLSSGIGVQDLQIVKSVIEGSNKG